MIVMKGVIAIEISAICQALANEMIKLAIYMLVEKMKTETFSPNAC